MAKEENKVAQLRRRAFIEELREHLEQVKQLQNSEGGQATKAAQELGNELEELGQWLNARFNELVRLLEISAELNKGVLLDDVLSRIYTFFREVIPYDRIGCALIDDEQKNVTAYWAKFTYDNQPQISAGYSAPLAGSSLARIISTGKPRILNDLEAYLAEHPDSESTRKIVAEGIRSSLTCPLLADGKPVGFLFFSSKDKYTYDGLHQEVFLYIASQVAHLIEKSRLYQEIVDLNQKLVEMNLQLEEKASRDALTGLYNRGAIMEFLQQRLASETDSLAVAMLDIDHFKQVNDVHGHAQGDLVLRGVATAARKVIPITGRLGRYGGEEFLLILPSCSKASAVEVAEDIRRAVMNQPFETAKGLLNVTISIGVAHHLEIGDIGSLNALLELADQRLYRAKESGRNKVVADEIPKN